MIRGRWFILPAGFIISALTIAPYWLLKREQYIEPEKLADDSGRFVSVDGVKTYYVEYGAPHQPTLIFMHGFGGSTFNWRYLLRPLAQTGYRTIAFDRPPFGLSDKPDRFNYDLSAQAAFTVRFMDALGIQKATLIGHSLGANVAMRVALAHPQRVQCLICLNAAINYLGKSPIWLAHLLRLPFIAFWSRIILRFILQPQPFARFIASTHKHPKLLNTAEINVYLRPKRLRGWDTGLLSIARHTIHGRIPDDHITTTKAPCLLIWGENDPIIPLKWGLKLHQLLPSAQWIAYPHVGHSPMEENPAGLIKDIQAFLAAHS